MRIKRHFRRLIYISAVVLALLPSIVLAIELPDTDPIISTIRAYQGVIETGDQFWLVTYDLDKYTTEPDELSSQAFLLRLKDNGVEIGAKTPYAYYNDGYSLGCVSYYFSPTDVNIPTWEEDDISVTIEGNPTLSWTGGSPPDPITNNNVDSWNEGKTLIPGHLTFLAQAYGIAFGGIDLVEIIQGEYKFTTYGEDYFSNTIENVRTIATSLFTDLVTQPEVREIVYTNTTKTTAENRLVGDPIFDLTTLAGQLGVSRMWLNTVIWLTLTFAVVIFAGRYSGSGSGLLIVMGIMFIIGGYIGFVSFDLAIWTGVTGVLVVVYKTLFQGASA